MLGDLTTLGDVTAYLANGLNPVQMSDQAMVRRLVSAASQFALRAMNRILLSQTYTEVRNGTGQQAMTLRRWPVTAYSNLLLNNVPIPASSLPFGFGWRLPLWDGQLPGRNQEVGIIGGAFLRGFANVQHTYTAGYRVSNEPQTVPATPFQLATSALGAQFAKDAGVSYANGTAMTAVSAAPTVGQYIAPLDVDGFYQFNAADTDADILVSYSFTPADIAQAVVMMVSEAYAYLQRIGVSSDKAGMSAQTYWKQGLTPQEQMTFDLYKDVVPV